MERVDIRLTNILCENYLKTEVEKSPKGFVRGSANNREWEEVGGKSKRKESMLLFRYFLNLHSYNLVC